MKRVIAILTPVSDQGMAGSSSSGTQPAGSPVHGDGFAGVEPGETRIEVVVSDDQAERILSAVLGSEPAREEKADSSLELAILNELRETEPTALNVLEQIVSKVERKVIEAVYMKCDRNKTRTAIHLGINRNTLQKKLRQFGATTEDDPAEELLERSGV